MKDKKSSEEIIRSIASDEIKEITGEVSEAILDENLTDGIFKELPVFGLVFKSISAFQKINDYFYLKKIEKFLFELKDIAEGERLKFIAEKDAKNELGRIGENVLFLLGQTDQIEKSSVIGKIFRGFVLGEIDFDTYQRISIGINKVYYKDLTHLKNYRDNMLDPDIKTSLLNAGFLAIIKVYNINFGGEGNVRYRSTKIGEIIVNYI
ncbi:MAG TPA: hypothetical protein VK177_04445 [Flavobacteriales bacterium]|nr:hypothetical protein [Flavobacteriales bacterium]